jgi:hypothetical protein
VINSIAETGGVRRIVEKVRGLLWNTPTKIVDAMLRIVEPRDDAGK